MIQIKKFSNIIKIIILLSLLLIIFLIYRYDYSKRSLPENKTFNLINKKNNYKNLLDELEKNINYIHCHEIPSKFLLFEKDKENRQKLIEEWKKQSKIDEIKIKSKNIIVDKIVNSSKFKDFFSIISKEKILEFVDSKFQILPQYILSIDNICQNENQFEQIFTINECRLKLSEIESIMMTKFNIHQIAENFLQNKDDDFDIQFIENSFNEVVFFVFSEVKKCTQEFLIEFMKEQEKVEKSLKDFKKAVELKKIFIIKQHFLNYEKIFKSILQKKEFILNHGFSQISYQNYQEKTSQQDQTDPDLKLQINHLKYIIISIASYLEQLDVIIDNIDNKTFNSQKRKIEDDKKERTIEMISKIHSILFKNFKLEEISIDSLQHPWKLPEYYQQNPIIQKHMTNENGFRILCKKFSSIESYSDKSFSTFPYEKENFIINLDIENDLSLKEFKDQIIHNSFYSLKEKNN
ncbi:MAG: hypothetical protein ACLTFB_01350 [Candidatus Phytoplasma pyri]